MASIDSYILDRFLNFYLERTTQNMEIRCLPSGKQLFTRTKSEATKFIQLHKNENAYFGTASRNGGGRAENARELPFLFADLDFKLYLGGEKEARQQLALFPLSPSFIIHSGNGLHCYWLITENIENAYKREKEVRALLLGIAEALKSDRGVCDIARIMRIPGSLNYKDREGKLVTRKDSAAKPVTVERWETSVTYALNAFVSLKEYAFTNKNTYSYKEFDTHFATLFTEGRRNSDLFHIAHCLTKGGAKKA